ncbi:M16 family metallopeptidase [Treponema primitia]|uniref:M16 family metallopeptidase n=1 Tax=Treponema primitia TaxID=88058 RepID=UPI0002555047|nr:M16 family metallopeptidase [Treponema primitia]
MHYFKRLALSLVLIPIIFSCATVGKPAVSYGGLGAPTDPIPFTAEARTGVLPSGLKYYILENGMPEGRAYLTLAVNAGSVLEKDDERGLAHFVEHMAFDGTERFPKSDLIEYLRSLGMRWGPEVNAYTSFDQTVYGIEVPVEFDGEGRKGIPDKALAVIDDWTRAISFTPADVDSERPVILEEHRTRRGAGERLSQRLVPIIYRGAPYAERLPIGLPEIIETAPAERLVNFYRTWYRADNMALVFVGDFDGPKLEADLAAHFSISAPTGVLERPVYDLPEPKKGNFAVELFTDPELTHTRIDLFYKLPSDKSAEDLASFRRGIIDLLIDRMLEVRFAEASYNPDTPFTAAGAGLNHVARSSRYYLMIGIAKTGSVEATLNRLLLEKEKMARYGFTAAEIDQTKRSILADIERQVSEKDRQHSSGYLDSFVSHFISGSSVTSIEWDQKAFSALLPGISAEEIAAAAKDYFAYKDLTVFISAPEAEAASLPTPARIRTLVRQSARIRIPRPVNEELDDKLLDTPPTPGSINTESTDTASGTTRWELSNGATVILKETKNKNNEIVLYAMAKGGITAVPEEQIVSADLAAEMLSASGIGPYSRPDLIKKLAEKQVSINFSLSGFMRNVQGSSTRGDLKTLFELLYLTFTQPRIDQDAVTSILDEYRTDLAQRDQNPEAVFFDERTRTIFSDNPWYRPMVLADLERVNVADALAIIRKSLNPADYTFVFTGNLDMNELRSYTETYLASIPRGETWNTWADIKITRPGKLEKAIYKGQEEKSQVIMDWIVPQEYSESGEATAVVLGEYLENRLMEITRKQMGGTYSLSAGVSQSILPPGGELNMYVYFPCDPNRVKELSSAILEELDLIAKGTINQDAFSKSVAALKKSFETSIQENSYISRNYANFSVIYDRPLSRLEKRPELYEAVTARDIQQAVEKLLPRGPVTVILYPENTKEVK